MKNAKPSKKRRLSIEEEFLRRAEQDILDAAYRPHSRTGLRRFIRMTLRWFRWVS